MNVGLRRGSKEWVEAIRAYYAGDEDIQVLCSLYEQSLEKAVQEDGKTETAAGTDDEWNQ